MRWKPSNTWVVYASLVEGHFDASGRRDFELVEAMENAGIPKEQVLFLPDKKATAKKILAAIKTVAENADENAVLLFVFSGHGGLKALDDEDYTCDFSVEGDKELNSRMVLDAINASFKGKFVLLIGDCCYSGAMTEDVAQYDTEIPIAALSSTAPFDSAWSGWLLIAQLLWLIEGRSWLDVDSDGHISLMDFFCFVEEEMAVVRKYKAYYHVPEGYESFSFHREVPLPSHEKVKARVLASREDRTEYARVLSVDESEQTALVQWLDRYAVETATVALDDCEDIEVEELPVGTRVKIKGGEQDNEKGKGSVQETFRGLHLVKIEGATSRETMFDWLPRAQLKALS